MNPRAQELIARLDLVPHPEGGFYRETHRTPGEPGVRPATTLIYFLLVRGQFSRWHRIDAEEVWHLYEGSLELLWGGDEITRVQLGRVEGEQRRPQAVVPAGAWQAARPLEDYALAACQVSPGFDFRSFEMLADDWARAEDWGRRFPEYASLI